MVCIVQEILTVSDTSPSGEISRKKEDKDTYETALGIWDWRTQQWEDPLEARTENSNKSWWDHTVCVVPPTERCAISSHSEADRALERACILNTDPSVKHLRKDAGYKISLSLYPKTLKPTSHS